MKRTPGRKPLSVKRSPGTRRSASLSATAFPVNGTAPDVKARLEGAESWDWADTNYGLRTNKFATHITWSQVMCQPPPISHRPSLQPPIVPRVSPSSKSRSRPVSNIQHPISAALVRSAVLSHTLSRRPLQPPT
ncbi:hypothetical protein CY34DRAFT_18278 [Suillus luteus UH-Slu-Lm8-n1]|uniref:Uncharacterized protein n=1 Tax=Suillus luteus UH-Slu-Lm8-n1 TaxID=930992 RepID=A0A0C9Z7T1_9AGAM|nr:hypothetical protein CY34DRAFT_18278 [Suillus luteus UH-Slu-Lm8-n1]